MLWDAVERAPVPALLSSPLMSSQRHLKAPRVASQCLQLRREGCPGLILHALASAQVHLLLQVAASDRLLHACSLRVARVSPATALPCSSSRGRQQAAKAYVRSTHEVNDRSRCSAAQLCCSRAPFPHLASGGPRLVRFLMALQRNGDQAALGSMQLRDTLCMVNS